MGGRVGQFVDNLGYEYDVDESSKIDYHQAFHGENEELHNLFMNVDPGNTAFTKEMDEFNTPETVISSRGRPARIMFYANDFTDEEQQKIIEFKEYCKASDLKIPENDPEILRFLVSRRMNPKWAYDTIMNKYQLRKELYPRVITKGVKELFDRGLMYVMGRDRFYRPVLVFHPKVVVDTNADVDDLLTAMLLMNEYTLTFMSKPGKVENCIFINNPIGLNVWNVPIWKIKRNIPLF